jgi:hypothetical protein
VLDTSIDRTAVREARAEQVQTDEQFPVRIGSENAVILRNGVIAISAEQVAVWRDGRVLAEAACATVRARRSRLSLGSALRMRVGDRAFAVDFSESGWSPRWLLLEVVPPLAFLRDVRAGRRAARVLLKALKARGADV